MSEVPRGTSRTIGNTYERWVQLLEFVDGCQKTLSTLLRSGWEELEGNGGLAAPENVGNLHGLRVLLAAGRNGSSEILFGMKPPACPGVKFCGTPVI